MRWNLWDDITRVRYPVGTTGLLADVVGDLLAANPRLPIGDLYIRRVYISISTII